MRRPASILAVIAGVLVLAPHAVTAQVARAQAGSTVRVFFQGNAAPPTGTLADAAEGGWAVRSADGALQPSSDVTIATVEVERSYSRWKTGALVGALVRTRRWVPVVLPTAGSTPAPTALRRSIPLGENRPRFSPE